jgi:hypothetical protein
VQAPPPPVIQHPSQAAIQASQQQQIMMQQTLQAAQMTRYTPPPSAPVSGGGGGMGFGWGGSMGQMASQQLNPFAAAGLAGSGYGMPNPMMMTSPSYGMFRPGGDASMGGSGGRVPSSFNPFDIRTWSPQPTLPPAHFSSPHMRSLQLMQAHQSQHLGAIAGAGEFGMGMAGAGIGGMLGSALGPLGAMGGAWLGSKIGHGVSNMMFGPVAHEVAQGRMIQQMSAPWMVSGSGLAGTGQGFSASAGQQVARGIHHMWRDRDFERTGFNSADATRIMNMSGQQGLLTGSQNPDEVVRRVKEISKSVKMLMQITGDPDVQNAIASLGQMRSLGFQGLASQSGAVANRAAFARMAGVSQAAMHEVYGMPGAMMAQQVGLAGSTGYAAGMAGGALSNLAASSGALNDLQLARAGGRSGLAQINTMAQISAMQSDVHLMASLKKGSKGIEVDMDAYRRAQKMDVGEVAREAAERTRQLGEQGIFEWRTRRQEFKDEIAQKLSPFEMNMNVVRQAQGLQRKVPGMNLGAAIFSTVQSNAVGSGMDEASAEQTARSLELQFTSRNYWQAQKQQLSAQKRQAFDQQRARWAQNATPGLMSSVGRSARLMAGDIGDAMSSPFRAIQGHLRRVDEDEDAAKYGERIHRVSEASVVHSDEERLMMREALQSQWFQNAYAQGGGDNPLEAGTGNRMANRVTSFLGLSSASGANRIASIANRARGLGLLGSIGDSAEAVALVNDVSGAADAMRGAASLDKTKRLALVKKLDSSTGGKTGAVMIGADAELARVIGKRVSGVTGFLTGGEVGGAEALTKSDLRAAWVKGAEKQNLDPAEAGRMFDSNPQIAQTMMETARGTQTRGGQAVLDVTEEAGTLAGAVDFNGSRDKVKDSIDTLLEKSGFGDIDDKTLTQLSGTLAKHSTEEVALAMASLDTDVDRREASLQKLRATLGSRFDEVNAGGADLLKTLGADAKNALADARSDDLDPLEQAKGLRMAGGGIKALAGQDILMAQLGEAAGDKSVANMDPMAALDRMDASDIEKIKSPELRKKLLAAKKAGGAEGRKIFADAVEGVSSRETRLGGSRSLDDQEGALDDMIASLPGEGPIDASTKNKIEAATTTLFADSVKTFSEAVKDLKGESEKGALAKSMPQWMSKWGGGGT